MEFSVVIPAYNEAANIEAFVAAFIARLAPSTREVLREIVIVENGSKDGTFVACQRLCDRFPDLVRVLSNERGSYGEAIKRGMLESRGTHISILECDFLDADFLAASVELFKSAPARFIVASKRHPESVDRRPLKRRILTRAFNAILKVTTGYPGTDTHGLKSVEAGLAKQLCAQAVTTDEVFQTEFVLLAWRQGNRIHELPIHINEQRATPLSIRRRLPMVADSVRQLRRSLRRFPSVPPNVTSGVPTNPANRASRVIRRAVINFLELALGLVLLYWIYRQGLLDLRALVDLTFDARFLAICTTAVALVVGAVALLSIRFMLVLGLQGITLPFSLSFKLTLIGGLFGALPAGLVAGDAVKAAYLVRGNERGKSKGVAAVIVDRAIGFFSLFALGSAASVYAWLAGVVEPEMFPILLIAPLFTLAGVLTVVVLTKLHRGGRGLPRRMISMLPQIMRNLMFALDNYVGNGERLIQPVMISILSHALVVLQYYSVAALVRDSLPLDRHFALDPLAMVLNAVPLTPGGLGITEGGFAYLFQHAGSINGALVGLLGRGVQYLVFFAGGMVAILTLRGRAAVKLES